MNADVNAIVGDSGRLDVWLSAEAPIIEDKLAIRGSARYYTFDGAWENNFPGGENLGGQKTNAWNLTLFATPTEDISIKLRHVFSDEDDGPAPSFIIEGTSNNCGPFGTGTRNYYCGTLSRDLIEGGLSVNTNPPTAGNTRELGMKRENTMTTLNIDWDLGGSDYVLSSVTGAFKQDLSEYRALQECCLDLYSQWTDESWSQELRLSSPRDRRVRWMLGAYYLELDQWKDSLSGFPSIGPNDPRAPGPRGSTIPAFGPPTPFGEENIENKAVFGSLDVDITDKLTASVELRYEEDDIVTAQSYTQEAMPLDSSTDQLAIDTARPFGGAEVPAAGTFEAWLPRVIVEYSFTDNTMVYGSYAEGNNPGAFNPEVIQLEPTVAFPAFQAITGAGYEVDQAELLSYEFGAKHSFANGRGYLNGAVYIMEWNNQVYRSFLPGEDSNGDGRYVEGSDRLGGGIDYQKNGSSEIWGFELAGAYALTDNWTFSGNYNYNKTEIIDLEDGANLNVTGDAQAAGNPIPRSPEHMAAFAVDFNIPAGRIFGQEGEWFARSDSVFQSESTTWVIGLAESESGWLHNLRGGWRGDRYSVTAWIENVLDDDPVLAAQRTTNFTTFAYGYSLALPQPRTYGLTISAHFGK